MEFFLLIFILVPSSFEKIKCRLSLSRRSNCRRKSDSYATRFYFSSDFLLLLTALLYILANGLTLFATSCFASV